MADDLYDQDFYLWTKAQAEALRAHGRGSNMLDYENLAEEIESLGSSERAKCASWTLRILQHLYELHGTANPQVTGHWRGEIQTFRADLGFVLTRSIRNGLEDELETLHHKAAKVATSKMSQFEPDVRIDPRLRWSLAEVLGEADDPLLTFEGQGRTDHNA